MGEVSKAYSVYVETESGSATFAGARIGGGVSKTSRQGFGSSQTLALDPFAQPEAPL